MAPWLLAAALLGAAPEGQLTVKQGDLQVVLSSQAAWTITSVSHQDKPLVVSAGGQGAVILLGDRWQGSAFEAGATEPVSALQVVADGQEQTLALPQTLTQDTVTVRKASTLGGLKHEAETILEKGLILQHHRFTAQEEVSPKSFYPFSYSLSPAAQSGLAQAQDGQLQRYTFAAGGANWPPRPSQWIAQYDPRIQAGMLAYLVTPLGGSGGRLYLWDTKNYHKLLYQPHSAALTKGTEWRCSLALQPFAAPPEQWETAAQKLAESLQQRFGSLAAPTEKQARVYGEGVPETGLLTCQTAHYTVPFSAERAWTIYQLEHDGKVFSGNNGFHGTVLIPAGGKFWGTGHGEGGKEVVHALRLTVDGQSRPVKVGETVKGGRVIFTKESTIWKFRALVEVTLTDNHVLERTRLTALEDLDLNLIYYFMHCFVPSTTTWLAQLPDGKEETGKLTASNTFAVNKDTRWVAQYEPQWQLGILCYTPRVIAGPGSASMIWDKANYHKYYLRSNQTRSLKAGEELDYSVIVQAVPQEVGDWGATRAAAAALMKEFPPIQ